HHIKLTLDVVEGPSNDIVKVYVDNALVHTGTSWENYYRYDSESSFEQSPRIVKTVIFRSGGTAVPADLGKGFLFDNYNAQSFIVALDKDQCKDGGWQTLARADGTTFKNQGDCVSYTNTGR